MRAFTADARTCCTRVRARVVAGVGAHASAPTHASPSRRRWTAGGFGAQAFHSAAAFSANIGVWNTALVTTLSEVCAAPGPAARHRMHPGRARLVSDAGRLCAVAPPMRARAHTHRRSLARGHRCRYGCAEGRFDICIRMHTYMYIYAYIYMYIRIYIYIHICIYV